MVYPLIEFGLSEFGAFEFGYEKGSVLVGTDLVAFGQGAANFYPQVVKPLETTSLGSSQAGFIAQTIRLSKPNIEGKSLVRFDSYSLLNVGLGSSGNSEAYFNPGYRIDSAMAGEGIGEFIAVFNDPETFASRGIATVNFVSGYLSVGGIEVKGKGSFKPNNFAYSVASSQITGNSSVSLKQGSWSVASLESPNTSSFTTTTQSNANAGLVSNGHTEIQLKNQTVKVGKTTIDGKSASNIKTNYLHNIDLVVEAKTESLFRISSLNSAVLESIGLSSLDIRPGSPVSDYLTPAWDVIYRPYENRGVIWR